MDDSSHIALEGRDTHSILMEESIEVAGVEVELLGSPVCRLGEGNAGQRGKAGVGRQGDSHVIGRASKSGYI